MSRAYCSILQQSPSEVAIDPRTRTGALPWAPVSLEVCERHAFVGWRAKPGTGPDRRHAPARVSELMLPARGRVARLVTPCVGSAVHGGVAIGPAERALRARSGLATMADDVTAHPSRGRSGRLICRCYAHDASDATRSSGRLAPDCPPLPDPLSPRRIPARPGSGPRRGPRRPSRWPSQSGRR